MERVKKDSKKKWLLIFIPLAIYLFFGLQHLTKFETADEHFWLYDPIEGRIQDYWRSIKERNWIGTRINDKPGITLAYVSGVGLFFADDPSDLLIEKDQFYRVYDREKHEEVSFIFRLPILIFNGLFAIYFLWIIKKLTEKFWIALFSSSLVLLNPVLIGISQIVNPDSLLWSFSFASFLSFLTYLKREENKYAVLSSVFLGLAMLSKYSAVIFMLYFALAIAIHFIFNSGGWTAEELKIKVRRSIFAYISIIIGALLIFSILMPAVFFDVSFLYKSTIGFRANSPVWIFGLFLGLLGLLLADSYIWKSRSMAYVLEKIRKFRLNDIFSKIVFAFLFLTFFSVLVNWGIGDNFLGIKGVAFDAGKSYEFRRQDLFDQFFLEFYPLIFSLTPLVLISIMFLWAKSLLRKIIHEDLVFTLSFFIVIFYCAVLQQQLLVNIRYTVLLYPILMLLSAIAIYDFFQHDKLKKIKNAVIFSGIVVFSFISIFLIKPFYFNYTSNLLPKNRIITGAWGYGGYEAAAYLNSLPDAKNLVVWTDYWGFCPFFDGKCIKLTEINKNGLGDNIGKIDYYVMTRRGYISSNNIWRKLKKTIDIDNPIKEIDIDGRPKNFIKIYKTDGNILEK